MIINIDVPDAQLLKAQAKIELEMNFKFTSPAHFQSFVADQMRAFTSNLEEWLEADVFDNGSVGMGDVCQDETKYGQPVQDEE